MFFGKLKEKGEMCCVTNCVKVAPLRHGMIESFHAPLDPIIKTLSLSSVPQIAQMHKVSHGVVLTCLLLSRMII